MLATFILTMLGAFCGAFMAIVLLFSSWDEEDMYDDIY